MFPGISPGRKLEAIDLSLLQAPAVAPFTDEMDVAAPIIFVLGWSAIESATISANKYVVCFDHAAHRALLRCGKSQFEGTHVE